MDGRTDGQEDGQEEAMHFFHHLLFWTWKCFLCTGCGQEVVELLSRKGRTEHEGTEQLQRSIGYQGADRKNLPRGM